MAKKRGRETARDMIFSMGAVLIPVLIILAITYRPHSQQKTAVDLNAAVQTASVAAPWPIFLPSKDTSVLSGWQLTQARFEAESYGQSGTSRWFLGYQSPDEKFVSVWQSDGDPSQIIAAASNDGVCNTAIPIAGDEWKSCSQSQPLTRAIYRQFDKYLIVISGTASHSELVAVAKSLVEVKNPDQIPRYD